MPRKTPESRPEPFLTTAGNLTAPLIGSLIAFPFREHGNAVDSIVYGELREIHSDSRQSFIRVAAANEDGHGDHKECPVEHGTDVWVQP